MKITKYAFTFVLSLIKSDRNVDTTVNANMIILAREARGFNQAELAEKIGMQPTNLSKIERNDLGVSPDTIKEISSATGFPISFFYQKGEIVPENVNYRKREKVAQKFLTLVNARVNIVRIHGKLLTEALNIANPSLPSLAVTEGFTPSDIAQKVRKLWRVKNSIIDSVTDLLEANGVVIRVIDLGTDRVDSRTILTDNKYPVIILNKTLLGDRQRFSLAYQLGHLIMHTFSPVDWNSDIGHEANLFAAEFLMPENEIREAFKDGVTLALLAELKRKWKVSMISLMYRADDLGFLTENQKRYLVQQFNDKKIRRREPIELDVPAEQPKLFRQWITELKKKKKIDVAGMAAELHMNTDEFIEQYS